ncbi:hypothetical protein R5R35_014737 [Gryllus longicercus]|uniref:Uncharacterized protein n=1 Tax=Gryllus longicercus TaxID=2509291 RepID=A0AAN9VL57_9ORTH
MGLILGLTFGSIILVFGLTALCFFCPICCWYKMRNSHGVVTYTNARPVPGGISTVTPQHPYPYPAGVVVHQQAGHYPPGTQGQVFAQGSMYVQGAPYQQRGVIYQQGNHGAQGPFPYPQGTVMTPQNAPHQQGQPAQYPPNMK